MGVVFIKVSRLSIIGANINGLVVLKRNKNRTYECRCTACGRELLVGARGLRNHTAACSCHHLTK